MKRLFTLAAILCASCSSVREQQPAAAADTLITNAIVYDGSGAAPYRGEVAIRGDRIIYAGLDAQMTAARTIDAAGHAVAPGFINMLSHSRETILHDGRAMSVLMQGVTLEVNSEYSLAPLTPAMRERHLARQGDVKIPIPWTTIGEYLDHVERRGVSVNFATFVGAGAAREHVLGLGDVDPTPGQLREMQGLVRAAMEDGALGVATMLAYVPERYAETAELTALASAAAACGGIYAAHIRNEGSLLLEAIDETVAIAGASAAPAHIHHLKQSGAANWGKLDAAIQRIETARASGIRLTADMYLYAASGTGATSMLPPWVQEGGLDAAIERLRDPATRARAKADMRPILADRILFYGFRNPALKQYIGKRLSEVAAVRGTDPADTVLDLIVEDRSRVNTIYFVMSEENVRRQAALPWMAFGSDASAQATEGAFLDSAVHPRTYGNFARLLGKYVREEKVLPLEEAIRKLTSVPAAILGLADRGALRPGAFADIVLFDPATIADRSTFEDSHRYAAGVSHVWVNGTPVIENGTHTGARPGRAVRGRGWRAAPEGGCRPGPG